MDRVDGKDQSDLSDELIPLKDLRRLDLKPGDRIVVRVSGLLPAQAAARLRIEFEKLIPGHQVIVLDSCIELSVLRESETVDG